MDDAILSVLRGLAALAPSFAEWLAAVIEGREDHFSRRVADILPASSASRAAAQELR